jgi:hypothetical protein
MKNILKYSFITLTMLTSNIILANNLSSDFIKEEIKIAHTQYLTGTDESALYALGALARLLESVKPDILVSEVGPNSLTYTYLRMGLLHEKSGNKSKANLYFTKAVSLYNGAKVEVAQLKRYVKKIDNTQLIRRSGL